MAGTQTVTLEIRHDRHRHGVPTGDTVLLALPAAQPIIARIAAATDPDYPDRTEHVLRIASLVVRAKIAPCNAFAKATLP